MTISLRIPLGVLAITAIGVACAVSVERRGEKSEITEPLQARGAGRAVMKVRGTSRFTVSTAGPCPLPADCEDASVPVDSGPEPPRHLNYYGGRVISQPRIVQVLWGGGGIYDPRVLGTNGVPSLPDFYKELMNSGVYDWLNEYDTDAQTIARGTFVGSYTINPSPDHNGATIYDAEIQAELHAHLDSGALPKPGYDDPFDYVYMIDFPQGKTVVSADNYVSCAPDPRVGFCGYHSTMNHLGTSVYYAVLPDLTAAGCAGFACGYTDNDVLGAQTAVASHELAEMITDPQIGYVADLSAPPAMPMAWVDPYYSEIGDSCRGNDFAFLAYHVQREWSNAHNQCFDTTACLDPSSCTGKCGLVTNGCGVQVDCGGCTAPQTCGGGGVANVCGCTPNLNACPRGQCSGSVPDGCGGFVQCHADCSMSGLCPCRGGQCSNGVCVCYKGACL